MAEYLLGVGAHVNAEDINGNTPLLIACRTFENSKLFKLLLKYGADIDHKNEAGETAQEIAEANGNLAALAVFKDFYSKICIESN